EMSDTWIYSKVMSRMISSRTPDGLNIKVDTNAGVVSLNCVVANFAEKELSFLIERNIRGVKGVNGYALMVMARRAG
ncbi:BON domain-containing protein, partial [Pseudomonas syringae pv. tagetis]|uniref:BON domain-containing protein n=1 Tax=Pseudomonas syringae group genomosp. 7 TaxID=251699 RepID=UPI00376FF93B